MPYRYAATCRVAFSEKKRKPVRKSKTPGALIYKVTEKVSSEIRTGFFM